MNKQFKLPNNYFDNFAHDMDAKIAEIEKEESDIQITTRRNRFLTPIISAAALAVLLISTVIFLDTQQGGDSSAITAETSIDVNSLSNEEYLNLILEDVDSEIIEEIIAEVDYNY